MTRKRPSSTAPVPRANPPVPTDPSDPRYVRLREEIALLMQLPPHELLDQLDLLQAGNDFATIIACEKNTDSHSYSDDILRADQISDFYSYFEREPLSPPPSSDMAVLVSHSHKEALNIVEMSGVVKFYDNRKGYGLISPDIDIQDVVFNSRCLINSGFKTTHAGSRIECEVLVRPNFLEAIHVFSLDQQPSRLLPSEPAPALRDVRDIRDWERVTVKWFNRLRGFGFAERETGGPDIYLHASLLRGSPVTAFQPGQVLDVRWGFGRYGWMAIDVRVPNSGNTCTP